MPGRERLVEITKESAEQARTAAQNLHTAATQPKGLTTDDVEVSRRIAKDAIDRAADSARIIVSEEGKG